MQIPSDEKSHSNEGLSQPTKAKLDALSVSAGKGQKEQCFDLATQMKGVFCADDVSSLDLERFRFDERKTVWKHLI